MKAEYKRDVNHNYLILYGEEEIDTASYQVRMLVGNIIPSLLKCRVQGIDGKFMIYYDITSRQSVASLYEQKKLNMENLRLIFGGFVQAMEEMSEYLLNPGQLIVDPSYMYLDVEKKGVYFCYLPGYQKDVREQFRSLTEYILPKIEHKDGKAVMLGYGVYRRALEDTFHLEYIKEELYKVRGDATETAAGLAGEKEAAGLQTPDKYEEETWQNLTEDKKPQEEKRISEEFMQGNFSRKAISEKSFGKVLEKSEEDEGKNSFWKLLLGCGLGGCIILGIIAAKFLGYLPGIGIEVILGGIIAGAGIGMLIYLAVKKTGKNKESAVPLQNIQKQKFSREISAGEAEENFSVSFSDPEEQVEQSLGQENAVQFSEPEKIPENYGETVVLSANPIVGPATLVSREPGELATIYLEREMTIIGKLETASDAVINLPTVSRVHAKIRKTDGEYYLSDLNSRNGTSVNGRLLKGEEDYQLQDQDEVDFAQARYVFLK